jgi:hypothetical protein
VSFANLMHRASGGAVERGMEEKAALSVMLDAENAVIRSRLLSQAGRDVKRLDAEVITSPPDK